MKPIIKKIIKRTTITLLVIIILLAAVIGIALNFVFTPEKLTPKVQEIAKEYVNGDISIGAVDLTFFSSFPRLGIRIKDVCLVSDALNGGVDSLRSRRDTVAKFDELRLGINVEEYLKTKQIKIGRIRLKRPQITLYCDSAGRENWNIMKADTTATDSLATDTTQAVAGIDLKYLKIENAKVRYANSKDKLFARVDSLNFLLEGEISPKKFDIALSIDDKSTSFSQNKMRYFRKLPLGFKSNITFDGPTKHFILKDTHAEINGVQLNIDGWVGQDSTSYDMDINFAAASPSIEAIFGLIPKEFIQKEIDVKSGDIAASGSITGRYSKKEMPVIKLQASIDGVQAKYEGMPYGIEDLKADFNTLVDIKKPKSSYANLNIFHFKGAQSEITATASAKELLADPLFDCNIQSHIDLNSVLKLFPMQNIALAGTADADIKATFRLSQIERQDFGRLKINGTLNTDTLKVESDSLHLKLNSDMHIRFASKDTMSVSGQLDRMRLVFGGMRVNATKLRLFTKALTTKDTAAVSPLIVGIRANRLLFRQDSIMIFAKNLRSRNQIKSSTANKKLPRIEVGLKVDTIMSNFYGTRGLTKKLDTSVQLERIDTIWTSDASAKFDEVRASTPVYGLPLKARNGSITKEKNDIKLNNVEFEVGQSNIILNGEVQNLIKSLRARTQVVAKLDIKADTLNFNQLLSAIVEEPVATDMTSELSDTTVINVAGDANIVADSMTMQLVKVPRNVHFTLSTNVKTVIWDKIEVKDIKGRVEVANAAIHMNALKLRHRDSNIIATIAYKAHNKKKTAEANFCIQWENADMGYLINAMGLDTVMPMLQPLRGHVSCALATNIQLDSMMNYDLHKIKAGIHIDASKLTLMDNETFSKISKILLFKNKKENVIDSVALNIMADSGRIEILPFIVNIDRYRAIVGGDQDIDMTKLNYHVSIIKSPLPFKAGVNITGTPDDIDIDITRAKLKNHATKEVQEAYDKMTSIQRLGIVVDCYRLSRLEIPAALKAAADNNAIKIIERARRESKRIERDTSAINVTEEIVIPTDTTLTASVDIVATNENDSTTQKSGN